MAECGQGQSGPSGFWSTPDEVARSVWIRPERLGTQVELESIWRLDATNVDLMATGGRFSARAVSLVGPPASTAAPSQLTAKFEEYQRWHSPSDRAGYWRSTLRSPYWPSLEGRESAGLFLPAQPDSGPAPWLPPAAQSVRRGSQLLDGAEVNVQPPSSRANLSD